MIRATKRFGDLFDYENKSKIKAGDGLTSGTHPFYTSSADLSKFLNDYSFEKKSLVFGTGGKASVHFADSPFSVSTDCLVAFSKDEKECLAKYVFYYLYGNIYLLEEGFKGAGLKHISKSYINELKIPLPLISEQKRIAEILDAANALRSKDLELLKKYDELAQAIFIDMFGDPVKNDKRWKKTKILNIIAPGKNKIRSGPFGSDLLHSEFVEDGIKVLGIDNVVTNKFVSDTNRYITVEKYADLKRYSVFPNDILITIMGTVGRCAIVPEDIGLAINTKHIVAMTIDKELVLPEFLHFILVNDTSIKYQLKRKSRGAIMDGLNIGLIKELEFNLPPINSQKEFINILKKIEVSTQCSSSTRTEELWSSLVQKAFRGKLL